jgi:hypothetical protein
VIGEKETMSLQLGNLAEWFAAVGTVATLGVSLWVLRTELRNSREERQRTRRHQAHSIASWIDGNQNTDLLMVGGGELEVCVRNASSSPISNCVTFAYHPVAEEKWDFSGVATNTPFEYVVGQLPPGATERVTISREWLDPARIVGTGLTTAVRFTDANGVHWMRSVQGELLELESLPLMC